MTIESNEKMVYDHILVRYGELSTKGKNKKDFIRRLHQNMKNALRNYPALEFERTHDRMYILLNGVDPDEIAPIISRIFGISSFSYALKVNSEIEEIIAAAFKSAKQSNSSTFKVEARRHYKLFGMISDEINRAVATEILKNTEMKVDVHNPELRIIVEVRQFETYIMTNKLQGAGGYPVGVGGKSMVMLSGGIDSPVAAYLMMKRGITVECIHYASPPYTSPRAQQKVIDLAKILAAYQGHIRIHVVPFTELQLAIYKHADESYCITLMRRMMYRIAERLSQRQNCLAIVNGESIGQVASQTLESMNVINETVTMPVIRPVVTMDKLEIIALSEKIGTYETSIQPFEDCCTIFTPKNPVTHPVSRKAAAFEQRFDYDALIEDCLSKIEIIDVYPNQKENIENDLF